MYIHGYIHKRREKKKKRARKMAHTQKKYIYRMNCVCAKGDPLFSQRKRKKGHNNVIEYNNKYVYLSTYVQRK